MCGIFGFISNKPSPDNLELTKRLLFAMVKLNKSTEYYSKWLIGLTIVLGILAVAQIIVGIYQIING